MKAQVQYWVGQGLQVMEDHIREIPYGKWVRTLGKLQELQGICLWISRSYCALGQRAN